MFGIGLALALIVWTIVWGIFGQQAVVPHFVNSDTLLPAHMAWDIASHDYALANFEWPRIPSLPDIAFFMSAQLLGIDWRLTMIAYSVLVALVAVLAIRMVLLRMRSLDERSSATFAAASGMALVLALSSTLMIALPDSPQSWLPQLFLILCVSHGNGFLISLFALALALDLHVGRSTRRWPLFGLCALGGFSDSFFLVYFLIPWTMAVLGQNERWQSRNGSLWSRLWNGAQPTFPLWLAALAGWLLQLPLPRQDFGRMEVHPPWHNIADILADLTSMPLTVLVLIGFAGWCWRSRFNQRELAGRADAAALPARAMVLRFGITAALLGLALMVLLYVDFASYRYALATLWWPVILGLGLVPSRGLPKRFLVAALVGLAALNAAMIWPLRAPPLLAWRSPLDLCLARLEQPLGLKAGLAPYWHSRLTMASRNWDIQLDQIGGSGKAFMWGNNLVSYQHDLKNPAQPPFYNYLVVDDTLERSAIDAVYGKPVMVAQCPKASIWVYDRRLVPPDINRRPPRFIRIGFH